MYGEQVKKLQIDQINFILILYDPNTPSIPSPIAPNVPTALPPARLASRAACSAAALAVAASVFAAAPGRVYRAFLRWPRDGSEL